jgi:hypothetical protein
MWLRYYAALIDLTFFQQYSLCRTGMHDVSVIDVFQWRETRELGI